MLTNYYYPIGFINNNLYCIGVCVCSERGQREFRKTLAETFIYDVKINKDETLKFKKS